MEKEIVNQLQEAQRVPYRINPKRNTPRHILIKLPKIKDKYRWEKGGLFRGRLHSEGSGRLGKYLALRPNKQTKRETE